MTKVQVAKVAKVLQAARVAQALCLVEALALCLAAQTAIWIAAQTAQCYPALMAL